MAGPPNIHDEDEPSHHETALEASDHEDGPDSGANPFDRTRRDHHTETAEDYVELVASLIERHGEARIVDMARELGIGSASVTRTVARLQKDGYLRSEPYRSVFLTQLGTDLAERCRRRHRVVEAFLRSLGVSAEVAAQDAEGIEHHVSGATLAAMEQHLRAHDINFPS